MLPDLSLKIEEITPLGVVYITSNDTMRVPSNYTDLTEQEFNIDLITNSIDLPQQMNFTILNFTDRFIKIQL